MFRFFFSFQFFFYYTQNDIEKRTCRIIKVFFYVSIKRFSFLSRIKRGLKLRNDDTEMIMKKIKIKI